MHTLDYQFLKSFAHQIVSKANNIKLLSLVTLLMCLNTYYVGAQNTPSNYGLKYKKGRYYLLNKKGKVNKKIDPFTFAEPFSEGLSVVEKNLKFGYIDSKGTMVIDHQFYDAGSFSNGLAYALLGDKYGFINKQGEFVIQPKFEMVKDFDGEYAQVLKVNPDTSKYGTYKWVFGFINKQGKLMADRYFSAISYNKKDGHFKGNIRDSVFYISQDGNISKKETKPEPVFYIVEEMPQYPGGDMGLRKFIASSVRYPISAQKSGLMGKVYVQFIVDVEGKVCNVHPVCKETPILMKESVRVVKAMPKWKPGKQDGKAVKVSYTVPINFVLQ